MAFTTDDCRIILDLSERHGVSQSHVVRSCFGIGLKVHSDVHLQSRIDSAAEYHAESKRDVIQAAAKMGLASADFGLRPDAEHSKSGAEGEQLRPKAKYPKRIAGLAFSEADYNAVRRISMNREVSEAQVVRECVDIGLAIYTDDGLRRRIEDAAVSHGRRERDVVYNVVKQGLNNALIWLRLEKLLWIRNRLRAEDPRLDLILTEHIHAVRKNHQPMRFLPPDVALELHDNPYEYSSFDEEEEELDSELQRLRHVWRETPLDELDQRLASRFDSHEAEAKEQARRKSEADQARRSELLELRGTGDDQDA